MTLLTERCVIRSLADKDRAQIVALSCDPDVRRHLGGPLLHEQAEARAGRLIAGEGQKHCWAVALASDADNTCIGLIQIATHHDGAHDELSYEFAHASWGRGLARESLAAVLDHAFTHLGYVTLVAETLAANQKSRQLLHSLGLTPQKQLVRFGEPQVIYTLTRR